MAERIELTSTATTEVVPVAPLVPLPIGRPGKPAFGDDDYDAVAEDLEHIVDGRRPRLRRAFDVTASAGALLVLSPVLLAVAIGIKLDSRGPVFYTQDRIGINRRRGPRRSSGRGGAGRRVIHNAGRPFQIFKFRTMRIDAEAAGPQWARSNDPRITRFGAFLRKTRLDEVPQFINVLRGEMTLIGPRPERPFFIDILQSEIPHYSKRLLVKPGITGLAQVNNGYDDSIESVRRKIAWDLRYIRGQGARADLRIVAKTIRTVLTGEGAC
jgi:lipopolysaccharide/colanic/teichoic acid biosynthesis glycosyltransferase